LDNYLIIKDFRGQEIGFRIAGDRIAGDRIAGDRIAGDYFYLFFPLPHFPTSQLPHFPTSQLPHHPTPHRLFLNQEIISPELNRDVFLLW
jgi:hypothetical protein